MLSIMQKTKHRPSNMPILCRISSGRPGCCRQRPSKGASLPDRCEHRPGSPGRQQGEMVGIYAQGGASAAHRPARSPSGEHSRQRGRGYGPSGPLRFPDLLPSYHVARGGDLTEGGGGPDGKRRGHSRLGEALGAAA